MSCRLLKYFHSESKMYPHVNVYVYSLDIPFSRVQQTAQFTPLVSELTLIRSHLLMGRYSCAFSAANDISQCHFTFHNSPFFRSTRYPFTAGWTEAVWYERFLPNTSEHTSNFSDLRELVTLHVLPLCQTDR